MLEYGLGYGLSFGLRCELGCMSGYRLGYGLVYGLGQGCPTRGPRAACGPIEELVRPFIALSSFTTAGQKE